MFLLQAVGVVMAIKDKTIELLIKGNGLKVAKISMEDIIAYIGERRHVKDIQDIEKLNSPAVYLLLDTLTVKEDLKKIYIGKSDNVAKRFIDHDYNKKEWQNFIIFTGQDIDNAHTEYLEKRMCEVAGKNTTTVDLMNKQCPNKGSKLSENKQVQSEIFFEKMLFILNNLGLVDILTTAEKQEPTNNNVFYMNLKKANKDKTARLSIADGKYILLKNSYIEKESTKSFPTVSTFNQWSKIINSELVQEENNSYKILVDIYFKSPSAASDVVKATSTNGRIEWRLQDGTTLGEYENRA